MKLQDAKQELKDYSEKKEAVEEIRTENRHMPVPSTMVDTMVEQQRRSFERIAKKVLRISGMNSRLLVLRYMKNWPWDKIADELHYSEAHVKSSLHSAALQEYANCKDEPLP